MPRYGSSPSRCVGKNKLCNIYTVEYYWAVKKKVLAFVTAWMDLENIMLSEVSQSEKDNWFQMISLICGR